MMRDRKHLVATEVEKLMAAATGRRHAVRDCCMLLLIFQRGLRVSEACGLRVSQVDIESRMGGDGSGLSDLAMWPILTQLIAVYDRRAHHRGDGDRRTHGVGVVHVFGPHTTVILVVIV
jgi:integrase